MKRDRGEERKLRREKRDERHFEKRQRLKNVREPPNPPDELSHHDSEKSVGHIRSKVQNLTPCFQLYTRFEFEFSARET